jgi:hypothetical protein
MGKRKYTYKYDSTVIFWNYFESTEFYSILFVFVVFVVVVVIVLGSILLLTQNGRLLSCASIAFSERFVQTGI